MGTSSRLGLAVILVLISVPAYESIPDSENGTVSTWRHTVLYKLKPSLDRSKAIPDLMKDGKAWATSGPVKAVDYKSGSDLGLANILYPNSTFAANTNYDVGMVVDFASTDELVRWWAWVKQQSSWKSWMANISEVSRAQTVVESAACALPKGPVFRALFAYRLVGGKEAPWPKVNYLLGALHWSAVNEGASAVSYTQGLDLGLISTLTGNTEPAYDIAGTKDFASEKDLKEWYRANNFQLPNKEFGNITGIIAKSARIQMKV